METEAWPDPEQLRPLIEAGYELIPLTNHDDESVDERSRGKKPRDARWTTRDYSSFDAMVHMEEGGNVGVRLRQTDLVIDVDPRNFGDDGGDVDPFSELVLTLGLDPTAWPCVQTGSGGFHHYLIKPADLRVLGSVAGFPGVEFKTAGAQVVAPGSVHAMTGRNYRWRWGADDLPWLGAPTAPEALLGLIARTVEARATGGGEHVPEEVAQMLAALDPEDFQDQDRWLTLMQACHHASAGSARQEFIEWSTSDPRYADHSEIIGRRWDSLRADADGERVTYRTLHKMLRDADRAEAVPARSDAADDFDELTDDDLPKGAHDVAPPPNNAAKALRSDAPMHIAEEMLRGKALLRSNGDWYRYDRHLNHYRPVEDE
ncbi:MAG: bifunctional DNA primase/polymerase, partial [Planctomycetota bacterium]